MVIVFFGNEKLATGVAASGKIVGNLKEHGYEIAKIYTKDKTDLGKINTELKNLRPDIGVLVAYGLMVPKKVIEIFPYGIINIHPSLLPKGRGPTPVETVILDGDKQTGVSIMQLSGEMDKGPVLVQEAISLTGKETKQELADKLLDLGNELLIKCLEDMMSSKKINKTEQSDTDATYTEKIEKSDGSIDWNKPAERLEREIRAYAGWPKSHTKLGSIDCVISEAAVVEDKGKPGDYIFDNKSLVIFTSDKALSIKRLKPAGKKDMSVDEFLRGYRSRLQT